MSFIDRASFPLFKTVSFKAADSKSNADLALDRMKSMRLPSIESCQSNIFHELHHREAIQVRQCAKTTKPVRVGLFGLPHRIGGMFSRPANQLH